jgi:hypothetical protein
MNTYVPKTASPYANTVSGATGAADRSGPSLDSRPMTSSAGDETTRYSTPYGPTGTSRPGATATGSSQVPPPAPTSLNITPSGTGVPTMKPTDE